MLTSFFVYILQRERERERERGEAVDVSTQQFHIANKRLRICPTPVRQRGLRTMCVSRGWWRTCTVYKHPAITIEEFKSHWQTGNFWTQNISGFSMLSKGEDCVLRLLWMNEEPAPQKSRERYGDQRIHIWLPPFKLNLCIFHSFKRGEKIGASFRTFLNIMLVRDEKLVWSAGHLQKFS